MAFLFLIPPYLPAFANERTLMAYLRTAMTISVGGKEASRYGSAD